MLLLFAGPCLGTRSGIHRQACPAVV